MKKTQKERLIKYLSEGKKITPEQAFSKFGTRNLRAAIGDIRQDGYDIEVVKSNRSGKSSAYVMR